MFDLLPVNSTSLFNDVDRFFNYFFEKRDNQFPEVNSWLDDEKNLNLKFILPGYTEKDINISFDGNYLLLESKIEKETTEKDEFRKSVSSFKTKYMIPSSKFNQEATEAKLKDGILLLKIPAKVEETKKIQIEFKE
ncbi:MAG: Hsp20/alpha crystallin family protein [Elusimicrobiota bacterium]|nr:Hsp20/alpha crystallin family protein [Elusimicrobiota bacterium]